MLLIFYPFSDTMAEILFPCVLRVSGVFHQIKADIFFRIFEMGEGADKELCLLQTVIHIVVGCKDKQSGQMAIGRIILVNIINGGCPPDSPR